MSDDNVYTERWDPGDDWSGGGGAAKRLRRGEQLGATVYELDPGDFVPYHFHHAQEELLIVLCGSPTLRTGSGKRLLAEGEVAHFPVGPEGAHALLNEADAPVRYVMVSSQTAPEAVEYPDLKQITVQAPTVSQTGEPLWLIHDVDS